MSNKNPDAIEAIVSIKNQSDDDGDGRNQDENLELQDMSNSKPKVWTESEKPKRPSLLERMRSSRSKSRDESSEDIEDNDEEEDEDSEDEKEEDDVKEEDADEIRPLGEDKKRKIGKSSLPKRPSFQKQTSRYEDRLRYTINFENKTLVEFILAFSTMLGMKI